MARDLASVESTENEGFYFLVGSRKPTFYGFVWRVWSQGTSFYVKARSRMIGDFKISIHGPDPRPGMQPGFKIDLDHSAPKADYQVGAPDAVPFWFPGWALPNGLTKVARIAVPEDTFSHEFARFGPPAGSVARKMRAGLVDPPPEGMFASLDPYLAKHHYEWPGKVVAERNNAIAGELKNRSGQRLIGLCAHVKLIDEPLPTSLLTYDAAPGEADVTRGVATAVDEKGFIWLCERMFSEGKLREASGCSHTT